MIVKVSSIELNRKGAQITVIMGSKSITRHAVRSTYGDLVGFNPDETSRRRRFMAVLAVEEALGLVSGLEARLKDLPKEAPAKDRRKLERELRTAKDVLKAAKLHQEKTLEEFPEKVIFV